MISKLHLLSFLATASLATAQDTTPKTFTFDATGWSEGKPPKEVFVLDGTVTIAAKDGNNAIMVDPNPIVDAGAQLGETASGSASIEARVFASKKGRSYPRFGVALHGMSGCRLNVNVSKKQVELVKMDQVLAAAPFTWTTDTWTKLKLTATKRGEGDWLVTAKAWAADTAEPKEPLITHEDKTLKGQGKAAVLGTPFSEMPIYFDDIKIEAAVAAGK